MLARREEWLVRPADLLSDPHVMKNYFAIASMGLALSLISCGKKETATGNAQAAAPEGTYVLATDDLLLPVGKTHQVSITMEMKDASLEFSMGGNKMEGTMSQKTDSVETAEALSAEKLRHVIVSEVDTGTVVMQGQEQPTPQKTNPIAGIPVIVENQNGKITATLENGSADDAQTAELEKIVRKYEYNEGYVMYGDTPRKPGDRWDADPAKLTNFAGGTNLSGTFSVEFKSIEEIDGVTCAKLECEFDLKGKTLADEKESEMAIAIKGKADVIRSIKDLADLDVRVSGTVNVSGEPGEGMSMSAEGPVTMHQKTVVKTP